MALAALAIAAQPRVKEIHVSKGASPTLVDMIADTRSGAGGEQWMMVIHVTFEPNDMTA